MSILKRSLVAVAVLGAIGAHAQSNVTLYGRVDTSYNNLHFSGPGGSSVSTVSSDTSYWGIRGSEDLGGGLSAYFKLESQFQSDTGAQGNATQYFNRESYIGLRSRTMGSVALGSQYTPHIWLTAKVDPFARGWLPHIANLFQGAPRGYKPQINNSVLYTTPEMGGFTGRVMIGARETDLATSHGAGLEYASGPMVLGISYDDLNVTAASVGLPAAQSSVRSKTVALGASYDFKVVRLMGYYQKNNTERLADVDGWMLGAVVPMGVGAIRVGYSKNSMTTTGEATQFGIGYTHALSKRTTLYTNVAKIRNEGTATASLWPGRQDIAGRGLPAGGQDVRGFQVGIRHLF